MSAPIPSPVSNHASGWRSDDEGVASPGSTLAAVLALRWQQGDYCRAEEILSEHAEVTADSRTALRVVYEEICLRTERGESVTAEELHQRFPQWEADIGLLLECHDLLKESKGPRSFPVPGDDFFDFRILRELGRGVHGRVYLADQPHLAGRLVVLKVTPCIGQEHLQLARLQHTNIVPLYSARELPEENLRYLCMPYLGGIGLAELLDRFQKQECEKERTGAAIVELLEELDASSETNQGMSPGRKLLRRMSLDDACCWIGICVADALHHAHEQGMIHLDLKPSNILIAADARPMLLDFHLARRPLASGSVVGWIGGTPAYMSPEQYRAWNAIKSGEPILQPVDARSDIYSLGVVLCEAFGGYLPIGDKPDDPEQMMRKLDRLPLGLQDIVRRCLETNPLDRYPTAAALADDLRRHLQDLPLRGVRNRSWSERWEKWRRRRPQSLRFAMLSFAFLIAMGIIGALAWSRYREADAMLEHGIALLESKRYARAAEVLSTGLEKTHNWPTSTSLAQDLSLQLGRAQAAIFASRLGSFVDQLRLSAMEENVPPSHLQDLERSCRRIWNQRAYIEQALLEPLLSDRRQTIRQDMLDFADLWIELQMRLADSSSREQTRLQALAILSDVDKSVGLNEYLRQQRKAHLSNADAQAPLEIAENSSDGAETAWQHFAIGRRLLHSREYAQASQHFDQAVRSRPNDFWSWFSKGIASYRMDKPEDAIHAFTVAIALEPDSAECYYNRALAEAATGDLLAALADYDQSLRIKPSFSAALLNRGVLHFQQDRLDQAERDFRLATTTGFEPSAAYLNLAMVQEARGELADAKVSIERALSTRPDFEEAHRFKTRLSGQQP